MLEGHQEWDVFGRRFRLMSVVQLVDDFGRKMELRSREEKRAIEEVEVVLVE